MAKRFGLIALPLQIVKQQQFAHKIKSSNDMVSQSTDFLKKFVQRIYDICSRSAKQLNKLTTSTQNKLKPTNRQQQSFNKFLTDLFQIFQCMQSQISRIIILLKNNKKYESIKKLNEVINQKLLKAGQNVSMFIGMVKDYNSLDQKYIQKVKYFQDIQKNPVKYYSITINSQKYEKIKKIEDQLQQKLEAVITIKGEIRVMMNELSNKIKDLYENFMRKIDQVRKSSQIVLLKIIQLIKGFHNIPEVSQRAQQQSQNMVQRQIEKDKQKQRQKDKKRQNLTVRQEIRQIKRDIIGEFQRQTDFKDVFFGFINNFLQIIKLAVKQMNDSANDIQYKQFYTQKKKFIVELLPLRSIQDIDIIIQAYKAQLTIFVGIQKIMRKDMFEQIFKYQKIKCTNFIQQIQQVQEQEIEKLKKQDQQKLYQKVKQKQRRYCLEQSSWKKQLQDKYKDIIIKIRQQFLRKGNIRVQEKASKQLQLFSQKHFEILKHVYFDDNKAITSFIRSDTIIKYQKIMKSNRIKNILLDIQMGNNHTKSPSQNKKQSKKQLTRIKASCCCFSVKPKKKSQEANLVNKIKKSKQIDHYTCALKNGYMLYQGRMTIYEDYLGFKSSFNPSTFFGSTDIFIPKFEIYQFIKGRHIMSEMITVVTKRGSIQFTSFFVDPFDVLNEVYKPNRNTENQIVTHHQMENNEFKSELEMLKQKMQTQFIQQAKKQNFVVNNIKSSLDQKQKILQIVYQYADYTDKTNKKLFDASKLQKLKQMKFQVTIKYYQNCLQYSFEHSQQQNLLNKQKLQMIAKNVIDEDRVQKFDNFTKTMKLKQRQSLDDNISFNMGQQFSIIGSKQKHRLDFGQFEMMPLAMASNNSPTNRQNYSQDLHRLLQQNQTKIQENSVAPKQYSKILNNLNPKLVSKKNNLLQVPQVKINNNLRSQKIYENQPITIENQNNSFKLNKQHNSISVSQNASTVKYGERKNKPNKMNQTIKIANGLSYEKTIDRSHHQQGIKYLIKMVAIAIGLIFLIKLFV